MIKAILSTIGVLVIGGIIALFTGIAKADTISVSNTNTNVNANANTNVINIGSGSATGSSSANGTVVNPVAPQPVVKSDPAPCNTCGGSTDTHSVNKTVSVSNSNSNANANANANAINIGSGSANADADANAEIDNHSHNGKNGSDNSNANANANANVVKIAGKEGPEEKTSTGTLPKTGADVAVPLLFSGIGTGALALIRRKNASFDYLLNA